MIRSIVYLIQIDYEADLADIDATLGEHGEWLDEHYRCGLFLASGRREPRTGGVVFAVGDRRQVEAAVAADPFAQKWLASHTVIEFHPSRCGGVLDADAVGSALG